MAFDMARGADEERTSVSSDSGEEPQLVDLLHLGRPQVIGSWRVGDFVVDPGPASCLEQLLPVLEEHPPRVIALTHIHLDHAGATGSLVRRFPDAEVWVHERGARHMADPSRLLASARRLYGENMDRLWGEFLPVPQERMRILSGGESLGAMKVAYTPGHASHHVSYLHEPTNWAFTGDVGGVRISPGPTIAPTPPPDIDLPAWRASLRLLEGWRAEALAITHFGVHHDVEHQLAQLREYLDEVEAMAESLDEAAFAAALSARFARTAADAPAGTYLQATPPEQSYAGLARYLDRKRAGQDGH
jgi:glyoxylase-like metal-dependent hydrolase (beta-lactamase superfamily II)